MKLVLNDGTEISIRKFTREYAANQVNKLRLNITANYETPEVFDDVSEGVQKEMNTKGLRIVDDDGTEIEFKNYVVENVLEIHDGMSNDILIRAYKEVEETTEEVPGVAIPDPNEETATEATETTGEDSTDVADVDTTEDSTEE